MNYNVGTKVVVPKNVNLGLVNFNYMAIHTITNVTRIHGIDSVELDSFNKGTFVSDKAVRLATDREIFAGERIDGNNP